MSIKEQMVDKLAFIVAITLFTCAYADNITQIGRYLTVANKPSLAQSYLLSQTIQVHFPAQVQTIKEAIDYLLRYSGYSLASDTELSHSLKELFSKPLPLVDRNFGPMPLKLALETLVGSSFQLVDDPLKRTVNFVLKNNTTSYKSHQSLAIHR